MEEAGSYPSAETQSAYSIALVNWVENQYDLYCGDKHIHS